MDFALTSTVQNKGPFKNYYYLKTCLLLLVCLPDFDTRTSYSFVKRTQPVRTALHLNKLHSSISITDDSYFQCLMQTRQNNKNNSLATSFLQSQLIIFQAKWSVESGNKRDVALKAFWRLPLVVGIQTSFLKWVQEAYHCNAQLASTTFSGFFFFKENSWRHRLPLVYNSINRLEQRWSVVEGILWLALPSNLQSQINMK